MTGNTFTNIVANNCNTALRTVEGAGDVVNGLTANNCGVAVEVRPRLTSLLDTLGLPADVQPGELAMLLAKLRSMPAHEEAARRDVVRNWVSSIDAAGKLVGAVDKIIAFSHSPVIQDAIVWLQGLYR